MFGIRYNCLLSNILIAAMTLHFFIKSLLFSGIRLDSLQLFVVADFVCHSGSTVQLQNALQILLRGSHGCQPRTFHLNQRLSKQVDC
jgi:hypothetical protein